MKKNAVSFVHSYLNILYVTKLWHALF